MARIVVEPKTQTRWARCGDENLSTKPNQKYRYIIIYHELDSKNRLIPGRKTGAFGFYVLSVAKSTTLPPPPQTKINEHNI